MGAGCPMGIPMDCPAGWPAGSPDNAPLGVQFFGVTRISSLPGSLSLNDMSMHLLGGG
jgi:hypothetical protein